MVKNKAYTSINICGLAIGITCFLLIAQYLRQEYKYDKHHINGQNTYVLATEFSLPGETFNSSVTSPPVAAAIKKDFPEVINSARLANFLEVEKFLLKKEDQSFFEPKGYLADSTFFQILTYDFLYGDPATALNQPFTIVISKTVAKKLFGKEDVYGERMEVSSHFGDFEYKITGVFDDEKYQSYIDAQIFLSMQSGPYVKRFVDMDQWAGVNIFHTYLSMEETASIADFESKLPNWLEKHGGEQLRSFGISKEFFLMPLQDMYFDYPGRRPIGPLGNKTSTIVLGWVAIFLILIACINFMNLTTARATTRAQEVGVRKVIGADKKSLLTQFMSESFLLVFVAVLFGYFLAEISLPFFNEITGKTLDVNLWNDPVLSIGILSLIAFCTIIAGIYPALYLSSFQPVKIFKGNFGNRWSVGSIRKGLVVFQFIISIALIQSVLVVNEQLNFLQNKDLGFDKKQKIFLPLNTSNSNANNSILKSALLQNSEIQYAGATDEYPGGNSYNGLLFYPEGSAPTDNVSAAVCDIDPGFCEVMNYKLLKGRLFSEDRIADTVRSVVINESMVYDLGFDLDNAVGKTIQWDWDGITYDQNIIGVIQDFHYISLYQEVGNFIMAWDPNTPRSYMAISTNTSNINNLLVDIEQTWTKINPNEPFDYFFLDEKLQQTYSADQRIANVIMSFAILIIFIACMGLIGLAAFAAERRTKEIGIRKVLGASFMNILILLSKDFLFLVGVALIIASPIAYYFMDNWLENFAYAIKLQWWMFLVAGLISLAIALFTISFQSIKAAIVDPIQALKTE